ncbi:hypothetical protein D9M71_690080 [compost metagenome]
MPQPVPHGAQLADGRIQLVGLGREHLPIDARRAVRGEHQRDLFERQARGTPQADQRQPLQHLLAEQAAKSPPADRDDQALLLVVAQRRGGDAGTLHHLGNIQLSHPLDLKST